MWRSSSGRGPRPRAIEEYFREWQEHIMKEVRALQLEFH